MLFYVLFIKCHLLLIIALHILKFMNKNVEKLFVKKLLSQPSSNLGLYKHLSLPEDVYIINLIWLCLLIN